MTLTSSDISLEDKGGQAFWARCHPKRSWEVVLHPSGSSVLPGSLARMQWEKHHLWEEVPVHGSRRPAAASSSARQCVHQENFLLGDSLSLWQSRGLLDRLISKGDQHVRTILWAALGEQPWTTAHAPEPNSVAGLISCSSHPRHFRLMAI